MLGALKSAAFVLTAVMAFGGCATPAQRKATEDAAAKKQMAREVDDICSLPKAERAAGIKKLKDQTGKELYCAK